MLQVLNEVRHGLRSIRKHSRVVAVVVLSLGLGIGVNTVILCWIQNILLRPLSGVASQERIVAFTLVFRSEVFGTVAYPDLRDYASLSEVFAGVVGSAIAPASFTVDDRADWLYGQVTTANFFDVLGVTPMAGRLFLSHEDQPAGAHPVVVLSHGYWLRRFGGSACRL
jgi:hypothetical protein